MKICVKTETHSEGKYLVVRRDGTIPLWPHFVLGGDDPSSPAALRAYAGEAERRGFDKEYVQSIRELADDFVLRKGKGDPDAPPHRVDNPAILALMRRKKTFDETLSQLRDRGADESTVYFYEREFYCLSNFSAFRVVYQDVDFDTAESAYHYQKFRGAKEIQDKILAARSAHDAFKIAQENEASIHEGWNLIRVNTMAQILVAKASQHEYVRRKLIETGDRKLVENSWRDGFWGVGEDGKGENVLGRIWMDIRTAGFGFKTFS